MPSCTSATALSASSKSSSAAPPSSKKAPARSPPFPPNSTPRNVVSHGPRRRWRHRLPPPRRHHRLPPFLTQTLIDPSIPFAPLPAGRKCIFPDDVCLSANTFLDIFGASLPGWNLLVGEDEPLPPNSTPRNSLRRHSSCASMPTATLPSLNDACKFAFLPPTIIWQGIFGL